MSSSSASGSTPAPEQQQKGTREQQRARKPPFADWPTIKILTPPQGRFSPKTDEWCFTYSTQSISGRIHNKEPDTRSICLRRVFAHEVRNVLAFKTHGTVGPDGKARYPLPGEGQATNLPRMLGGLPKDDDSEGGPSRSPSAASTKHWDQGWYFWSGKGVDAQAIKIATMMMDLQQQQEWYNSLRHQKAVWREYQDDLKQAGGEQVGELRRGMPSKWWGPIVPSQPIPDTVNSSLLISLPPEIPSVWEKIDKFLAPTYQVARIFQESITSGEQQQFAKRVWAKAQTDEPFILAKRTLTHAYKQWKQRDAGEGDDEKKGST